MPNRIISSGILTSDSLSQLTWFEQAVFFRLLVLADDYGRYDGRPAVIRGQAFSLHNVTNSDIEKALSRLAAVDIVSNYVVDGRPYLQLEHWGKYQRLRNSKEKFPPPPDCKSAAVRRELPRDSADCGLNPNPNPKPNPNTGIPPIPPTGAAEEEADLCRCSDFYQQNIGTLSPSTFGQLKEWLLLLSADVIILAIQSAADNGKRNWAYIRAILNRCADTGIRSAADWEAAENARRKPVKPSDGNRSPVEETRAKLRQIAGGGFDDL